VVPDTVTAMLTKTLPSKETVNPLGTRVAPVGYVYDLAICVHVGVVLDHTE